jgi:hypothetical protein
MQQKYKKSITIKDYKVESFHGRYSFVIPKGSIVSNEHRGEYNDAFYWWKDYKETAEKITGFKKSMLDYFIENFGFKIPLEYCQPYESSIEDIVSYNGYEITIKTHYFTKEKTNNLIDQIKKLI